MRLLNVHTLKLKPISFDGEDGSRPAYAILSHTWDRQELSFQDFEQDDRETKEGFAKIRGCCEQAKRDGLDWVWIDTCCIDKTNSAELSEAINSMYAWYRDSTVCYAFLQDVPPRKPYIDEASFAYARWFSRGWCLQELIAPSKVEFYALDWTLLGTKWSLQNIITKITAIPSQALFSRNLDQYSIAQRMSWAANRKTSRVEDEAYCLLGIFDIQMPLIYGEGRKSFIRLQTEILQRTEDYSFLIWTAPLHQRRKTGHEKGALPAIAFSSSLFPKRGAFSVDGTSCQYEEMKPFVANRNYYEGSNQAAATAKHPPQLTSRGLRAWMFVRQAESLLPDSEPGTLLLWTEHTYGDKHICITIVANQTHGSITYDRAMGSQVLLVDGSVLSTFQLQEIYLTIYHQARPVAKRWIVPYLEGVEVILSTPSDDTEPTFKFKRSFPADANLIDEGFVERLGGQRFYSSDARESLSQFQSDRGNWPLSLEFEVSSSDGNDGTTESLVLNMWLDAEFPRCHGWIRSQSGLAGNPADQNSAWFTEDTYDQSTDMMELDMLNGTVTVVVVVKCRESAQKRDKKPSFFSAFVNVLHKSAAGDETLSDDELGPARYESANDDFAATLRPNRVLSDRIQRKLKITNSSKTV
jgi:hypothetical protein